MADERGDGTGSQGPTTLRDAMPGARRGWPVRRRLQAPDSFGLLLMMILLSMLAIAALADGPLERSISIVVLVFTLLFALRTSQASRRAMRVAAVTVPLIGVAAIVATTAWSEEGARTIAAGATLLLLFAVSVAILRRMGTHVTISWETLLAAICLYLLIGLIFGSIYQLLASTNDGMLFAGSQPATNVNTTYFSFTTLTTVGYGDLTMAEDLPKMIAMTEAVTGQVFLVVAVGLLVGNLGRSRRRARDD